MPPKIRELVAELERAGFVDRGRRGDHRNFVHPHVVKPVTIRRERRRLAFDARRRRWWLQRPFRTR